MSLELFLSDLAWGFPVPDPVKIRGERPRNRDNQMRAWARYSAGCGI